MSVRLILIAGAMFVSASAFAADAPKAPAQQNAQSHSTPAQVVLASAGDVRAPSATEQQAPAATPKRRIVRVTSCRCGDQANADPEAQPEQ